MGFLSRIWDLGQRGTVTNQNQRSKVPGGAIQCSSVKSNLQAKLRPFKEGVEQSYHGCSRHGRSATVWSWNANAACHCAA